jgi:hypothetical protein
VSDFTPIAVRPRCNDGSDAMAIYNIYILLRTQLIRSQLADQKFEEQSQL